MVGKTISHYKVIEKWSCATLAQEELGRLTESLVNRFGLQR